MNIPRINNGTRIDIGLESITLPLAKYFCEKMKQNYGLTWWENGVLKYLKDSSKKKYSLFGEESILVSELDIQVLTYLIAEVHWNKVFSHFLNIKIRKHIRELRSIRNNFSLAHRGGRIISESELEHSLKVMIIIIENINENERENVKEILEKLMLNYNEKIKADFNYSYNNDMKDEWIIPLLNKDTDAYVLTQDFQGTTIKTLSAEKTPSTVIIRGVKVNKQRTIDQIKKDQSDWFRSMLK